MRMQQQMIGPDVITYTGVGTAGGSTILGWLGHNHHAIASMGVIAGVIIGLIGLYFQYKRIKK